ncbi:hypothetical protein M9H77_30502 [Catharanthus roseus]|uniref:Uncharacterized protein n=1 Tax=Catharanthus roseus TaxID=4058 RepID=A0ACB9ZZ93_CATRO|nr:hypothetical protein M9H77_30502 [Catharanthus roseus]
MTHSSKMAITCAIRVQWRRFKIHLKAPRMIYKFSKDTKNHFEGQTKLIIEWMQNLSRKDETEPTGNDRLPPYCPYYRHLSDKVPSSPIYSLRILTPQGFE